MLHYWRFIRGYKVGATRTMVCDGRTSRNTAGIILMCIIKDAIRCVNGKYILGICITCFSLLWNVTNVVSDWYTSITLMFTCEIASLSSHLCVCIVQSSPRSIHKLPESSSVKTTSLSSSRSSFCTCALYSTVSSFPIIKLKILRNFSERGTISSASEVTTLRRYTNLFIIIIIIISSR